MRHVVVFGAVITALVHFGELVVSEVEGVWP